MQINIKVFASWHYCFWQKWAVQNNQNSKLIMSSQYLQKKVLQLLCVLLRCKTFRYFMRSSLVWFYLLILSWLMNILLMCVCFNTIFFFTCHFVSVSTNLPIFGDLGFHCIEWLPYPDGTDWCLELNCRNLWALF